MAVLGGTIGYHWLKWLHPPRPRHPSGDGVYVSPQEKLQIHFGDQFLSHVHGKTVIDFGCGHGHEAIEFAKRGAREVIGLELQDRLVRAATQSATRQGVADRCRFQSTTDAKADIVVSLDSFEHFEHPAEILEVMAGMLSDEGEVWLSYGWSWYHPHGGHLFSVFPWAHLVFTEAALIRWRSDFVSDGATRFSEVAGGLNQMTIRHFERLVDQSSLQFEELRLRPIHPLRYLHCRATREFTTALVFARLKKRV